MIQKKKQQVTISGSLLGTQQEANQCYLYLDTILPSVFMFTFLPVLFSTWCSWCLSVQFSLAFTCSCLSAGRGSSNPRRSCTPVAQPLARSWSWAAVTGAAQASHSPLVHHAPGPSAPASSLSRHRQRKEIQETNPQKLGR